MKALPTLLVCLTALLIAAALDWRWQHESKLNREERILEFLLLHPDLRKPQQPSQKGGVLIIPGDFIV